MQNNYNPDVLSCLANLSNDEVFTPPNLVNHILDLLPQELWSNPNVKFLDPVSKSGVFLREIAKRLINGLEKKMPNKQKRINHIFENQLFGIATTELTALLSRRSVYCSKVANGKYSVCESFDNEHGNIRYERQKHNWYNGKCSQCGASKEVYDRGDEAESYAYNFIHSDNPERLFSNKILKNEQEMIFDVIVGNPPYQLADGSGGSSDSAIPIYNRFIEQAKKLNPRYLAMITPSKWMFGGRGLKKFRKDMLNDKRIRYLYDFEKASDCFPGVHIDGGVSYFLWDREYEGKTEYTFQSNTGVISKSERYLKNNYFNYVIRDNNALSIISKVSSEKSFAEIVSFTRPYGIRNYLFNEPHRYPESKLDFKPFNNSIRVYGVKGIKGGARRIVGYVTRNTATKNIETIDMHKIFFTTSFSTNAVHPPEVILGEPGSISTETFLMIGPFKNENEMHNCKSYIDTNFFKVLLYFGKGTMHVTPSVFGLIPLQSFTQSWSDKKLYKKYKLSKDEISFIENMINPSEVN